MTNKMIVMSVTIVVLAVANITAWLYVDYKMKNEPKVKKSAVKKVMIKAIGIEGMTCEDCEITISAEGEKIPGVLNISASSSKGEVIVKYDASTTDIETIMKEIRKTGYRPVSSRDVNADYTYEPRVKEGDKAKPAMKCGAGKCGSSMNKEKTRSIL